jgi:hypothetical protein
VSRLWHTGRVVRRSRSSRRCASPVPAVLGRDRRGIGTPGTSATRHVPSVRDGTRRDHGVHQLRPACVRQVLGGDDLVARVVAMHLPAMPRRRRGSTGDGVVIADCLSCTQNSAMMITPSRAGLATRPEERFLGLLAAATPRTCRKEQEDMSTAPWGTPRAARPARAHAPRVPQFQPNISPRPCRHCGVVKTTDEMARAKGNVCRECDGKRKRQNRNKPERAWAGHLRRTYGITPEDYQRIFEEQDGVCALCHRPERGKGGRHGTTQLNMAVDHDHVTGKVRALLCNVCNLALGLFEHDPDLLEAAAMYVRETAGELPWSLPT